jgi:hypothetical protein
VGGDDLEPVELEPLDVEARPRPPRAPLRIRPRWVAVAAALVAMWIVIAVATRGDGNNAAAPLTPATATPNRVRISGALDLLAGLQGVGSGHFAVVINDELRLIDPNAGSDQRVDLRPGPLSIESQNGSSLVVRQNNRLLLVGTNPISVEPLPRDDQLPIATLEPDHWWMLSPEHDGIVQRDGDGPVQQVPAGLRLLAAVDGGFLASTRDSYVLWDGWHVRTLPFHGSFLDATSRLVAVAKDCPGPSCLVDIADLPSGATVRLPGENAERGTLSPDGSRLAGTSALSFYVTMLDTTTGLPRMTLPRRATAATVAPFTWTPSGDALLVLTNTDLAVVRASDGVTERTIDDGGAVQQIVALP